MKTSIIIFVSIISSVLSSCSGSKFTTRKYTAGIFKEHRGTIKHNTIYVDTTKRYTSLNDNITIKHPVLTIKNGIAEDAAMNSTIKKDSAPIFKQMKFYSKRKKTGKSKYLKNNKRVKHKIENTKSIDTKSLYKNQDEVLKQAKSSSKNAIGLCVFPIIGLVATLIAIKKFNVAKKLNSSETLKKEKITNIVSLLISILSILAVIAYAVYILYLISESFGNAVTIAFNFM